MKKFLNMGFVCLFLALSSNAFAAHLNISGDARLQRSLDRLQPLGGECAPEFSDGLYEAVCVDGVVLKMRRYRPSVAAGFREGRQPVLIFCGILENMNQFLPWTPPECARRYKNMRLRSPLAEWARDDSHIKDDPMLYFNLGHFLGNRGYDPWFLNYRGVCRGAFRSQRHSDNRATLDTWITLDTPAAISRVVEVTGLKPVIGGHSTGGFVSYAYLQGVYVDEDELKDGYAKGYNPRVRANEELARRRNELVRGVIALDPAGIVAMPPSFDNVFFWYLAGDPLYINLRALSKVVAKPSVSKKFTATWVNWMFDRLYLHSTLNDDYDGLSEALNIWNTHDKHPNMTDWIAFHVLDSAYSGGMGQYLDFYVNRVIREHWQNGPENADLDKGPAPVPGDGYYSYKDHMDRVKVPFITLLGAYNGLVEADEIIADLMHGKTPNPLDKTHVMPDCGHMNVYEGYLASTVYYPMISEWLRQVCGGAGSVMSAEGFVNLDRPEQPSRLQ